MMSSLCCVAEMDISSVVACGLNAETLISPSAHCTCVFVFGEVLTLWVDEQQGKGMALLCCFSPL